MRRPRPRGCARGSWPCDRGGSAPAYNITNVILWQMPFPRGARRPAALGPTSYSVQSPDSNVVSRATSCPGAIHFRSLQSARTGDQQRVVDGGLGRRAPCSSRVSARQGAVRSRVGFGSYRAQGQRDVAPVRSRSVSASSVVNVRKGIGRAHPSRFGRRFCVERSPAHSVGSRTPANSAPPALTWMQ